MSTKSEIQYCQAIGRRQYEASSWGESQRGCERKGIIEVDGHWACKLHADPDKRYGWNWNR
jgi:hypothetical protein